MTGMKVTETDIFRGRYDTKTLLLDDVLTVHNLPGEPRYRLLMPIMVQASVKPIDGKTILLMNTAWSLN